mmetsp:Transcript_40538/g.90089  ORF Transcript_40538/g.90089 Transcript_40538/m.90089 type:complete len:253 (+) Transcript_40538:2430-3188(+)
MASRRASNVCIRSSDIRSASRSAAECPLAREYRSTRGALPPWGCAGGWWVPGLSQASRAAASVLVALPRSWDTRCGLQGDVAGCVSRLTGWLGPLMLELQGEELGWEQELQAADTAAAAAASAKKRPWTSATNSPRLTAAALVSVRTSTINTPTDEGLAPERRGMRQGRLTPDTVVSISDVDERLLLVSRYLTPMACSCATSLSHSIRCLHHTTTHSSSLDTSRGALLCRVGTSLPRPASSSVLTLAALVRP